MNVEALRFKQSVMVAGGILIGGSSEKNAHGSGENVSIERSGKKGLQGPQSSSVADASQRLIFGETRFSTQDPKKRIFDFAFLIIGVLPACMDLVNAIHPECLPYVLITSITGVLFLAALISLWVLRKAEAKLLKTKDTLEKQVVQQQRELLAVREDANAWRGEMQRQFDCFRDLANDQLKIEEQRFDDLLEKSREREQHLQTALEIAKQMCADLPGTKARLMHLESMVGLDAGEHLCTALSPTDAASDFTMSQIPDLNAV
jgi:hypothetical protein